MFYNYFPFYIGGIGIAIVAIATLTVGGDYLGITRGYVSVCSIFSKNKEFHKPEIGGPLGIRTFFTIGVLIGGFLGALYAGGYNPSWEFGMFDKVWGNSLLVKGIVLITGGFLWGYGSRLAGGCTSGNTISGISRGSIGSIVATIFFMVGGVFVVQVLAFWLRSRGQ